jgi:hypothetical protein
VAIDEQLAAIAAPASLLLVMLYLYFHVLRIAGMKASNLALLSEYPWAPLFGGEAGRISGLGTTLLLPAASLAVFCVRVWRSSLAGTDTSIARGLECLIISCATLVTGYVLERQLNNLGDGLRAPGCSAGEQACGLQE